MNYRHSAVIRRFGFPWAAFWLALWAAALSLSAASVEKTYTVRRGDTLWGIARENGIPIVRLAERNDLSKNNHVYAGLCLIIPSKSSPNTPPTASPLLQTLATPALPSQLQRAIDNAAVQPGRWKYIVIHHSGVDTGTVQAMDRYHREVRHMENGLAYHFVIGNCNGMGDGEIAVGSRWTKQLDGGHLGSERQNKVSLGICLVGNFDKDKPTAKQMRHLRALVLALMTRCQIIPSAVKTHRQVKIAHTRCPGRFFPAKQFLGSLKTSSTKSSPTK